MNVIQLNSDNFNKEVIESQLPVIVDFWATWCGPCRMLAPIVEEISNDFSDKVKVCKLNIDEEEKLAISYGIEVIPTLLLFKEGKVVKKSVGYATKDELIKEFEL